MSFSVRVLQIGEMISISENWLDQIHKPIFLSIPEIAPLFGKVETGHASLVAARSSATADALVADLADKADVLDDRHDNLARSLYYLLLAAQYHALGQEPPDEARADKIDRALSALFPNALNVVVASYQAEAGNAAQIEKLATGELAPLLSSVAINKDVLATDISVELGAVGRELGAVENQKVTASAAAEKNTLTASEVRQRMRTWSSLAETVLANLEHSNADPTAIEAIRAPLIAADEKATTRRKERSAANGNDYKHDPQEGKTGG